MIKVWIFSEKFPNTIQPWLANSIAQVVRLGGQVSIFSNLIGDKVYSHVVDRYDLLNNVEILHFDGFKSILKILTNFLSINYFTKSFYGIFISPQFLSKHKNPLSNIVTSFVLAPYLVPQNIDIIHSHFEISGHKLLPIVRAQKVPFVITFHGLPPPNVNQLPDLMRFEYTELASVILVNTEFARSQYEGLNVDKSKIQILPQGTDTKKFKFIAKPYPDDGVVKILTVGRLSVDKGQKYALEAIAQLIRNKFHIEYTIVGQGPDIDKLISRVKELDIEKFVSFKTGLTELELIEEYHLAHIFILPSLRDYDGYHEETQGVVIQEAQSCGAIVVATKTGGIPECVKDGETAFLVENRNANVIAEKVKWIINNPLNWSLWQENARKSVEEKYDIDVIGEKLMRIYKGLIVKKT
jgi:colanic acid/amylovoran biosynthesis glycosyltransferase